MLKIRRARKCKKTYIHNITSTKCHCKFVHSNFMISFAHDACSATVALKMRRAWNRNTSCFAAQRYMFPPPILNIHSIGRYIYKPLFLTGTSSSIEILHFSRFPREDWSLRTLLVEPDFGKLGPATTKLRWCWEGFLYANIVTAFGTVRF